MIENSEDDSKTPKQRWAYIIGPGPSETDWLSVPRYWLQEMNTALGEIQCLPEGALERELGTVARGYPRCVDGIDPVVQEYIAHQVLGRLVHIEDDIEAALQCARRVFSRPDFMLQYLPYKESGDFLTLFNGYFGMERGEVADFAFDPQLRGDCPQRDVMTSARWYYHQVARAFDLRNDLREVQNFFDTVANKNQYRDSVVMLRWIGRKKHDSGFLHAA